MKNEPKYENLHYASSKLSETNKLSDHNKQVLDDFFDKWRHRVKNKTTCEGYANKWLNFSPYIDFKIDEPTREDIERLYKKLERGEICKKDGSEYSPHTKKKHHKALSTFYKNFIDYPNRGYNRETHGPGIVAGQETLLDTDADHGVKKETKPSPTQVREIASNVNCFRDRCVLIFCWSVGARAGEIFRTPDKPQSLLWEDIRFNEDDTMTVHLGVNNKKKGGNRRRVNVIVGKPMMKRLYDQNNPDPKDPVFLSKNPDLKCPRCSREVHRINKNKKKMQSSYNRKYTCDGCEKTYKRNELTVFYRPLSRARANGIIAEAVNNSDYRNLDKTSHKFFRKARALQKVAMNWNDASVNGFFGWEIGSDAKKKYIEALQVSQRKDLNEEHPELDINVEGRFHDSSLRPSKCVQCDTLNSRLWDFCKNCSHELTYKGMAMKGEAENTLENQIKHETKDDMIDYLSGKSGISESEVKNKLMEKLDKKIEDRLGEKD